MSAPRYAFRRGPATQVLRASPAAPTFPASGLARLSSRPFCLHRDLVAAVVEISDSRWRVRALGLGHPGFGAPGRQRVVGPGDQNGTGEHPGGAEALLRGAVPHEDWSACRSKPRSRTSPEGRSRTGSSGQSYAFVNDHSRRVGVHLDPWLQPHRGWHAMRASRPEWLCQSLHRAGEWRGLSPQQVSCPHRVTQSATAPGYPHHYPRQAWQPRQAAVLPAGAAALLSILSLYA